MLSILSNVNTDFIVKTLSKDISTVPAVGYGNIWGQILDHNSTFNSYNPDKVAFIIDIEDLICEADDIRLAKVIIDTWFETLRTVINDNKEYFVSDVCFRSNEVADNDVYFNSVLETYWETCLTTCVQEFKNVHIIKIKNHVMEIGKRNFYSEKLWYLGKIPFTNEATKVYAEVIKNTIGLTERINSKVLVLDLDNTLWGGVLGEKGPTGIELSDDHIGAIFKNVQRKIKKMQKLGVILAICSKNNESDVDEVWLKNPHMLLKKDDFIIRKINWEDKVDNIIQIANELNVNVDSFVFIDDMPNERENVSTRVPGVIVPDFPAKLEEYPVFIDSIFDRYFKHVRSTKEDNEKTQQYIQNLKREKASKGITYEEFLKSLKLVINRVDIDDKRLERIVQLIGKTNQFNLTTRRYTSKDIDQMLKSDYKIYAYNIKDKFGDYGLVAVVIVDIKRSMVDSFLMSCRVMGKMVENYIMNDVENDLLSQGIHLLHSEFIRTSKNKPVEKFYEQLGYRIVKHCDNSVEYEIDLDERPNREFYVEEL